MISILQIATIFFIIANPIGNSPAIIALLKDHDLKSQQRILFRESMFAMFLAIFFLFVGEAFLRGLQIQKYALSMSGGILQFVVSLSMIFSFKPTQNLNHVKKQDPYIVPIATPLITGAGLLTMVMVTSQQVGLLPVFFAILIAWIGVTAILVFAPYMQLLFGKRGMLGLEQLMGMILCLIGINMIVYGITLFLNTLSEKT